MEEQARHTEREQKRRKRPGQSEAVEKRSTYTWRSVLFKALWLLLYPAAFLCADWMKAHPEVTEHFFSQGLYPPLSTAVGAVFSIFPFSFAEVLAAAICIFFAVFIPVCLIKALRRHLSLKRFLSWILTILIVGGAGCNAFYWMWGFNYYRMPLRQRMDLPSAEKTPELLAGLCFSLADAANAVRKNLPEDDNGVFWYPDGKASALRLIPAAYRQLGERMPMFARTVYNPKPVFASELLSDAGISGIFIPFTEEANVNVADPALLVGSSAAHETAHFLGVASEDEANFTAYLACMASGNPNLQYSGLMLALVHAGNALADVSPEMYSELWDRYSDQVLRDFDQYNTYLRAHEGETQEAVEQMNDNYLKSHGQAAGVASYGQMVDLLLDYTLQT